MTNLEVSKPQDEVDKWTLRQNNFFGQTQAENNQRLTQKLSGKVPEDLLNELKFLESLELARGRP